MDEKGRVGQATQRRPNVQRKEALDGKRVIVLARINDLKKLRKKLKFFFLSILIDFLIFYIINGRGPCCVLSADLKSCSVVFVPIPRREPTRDVPERRTPRARLKSSESSSRIRPNTGRKWRNKPGRTRRPSQSGKYSDASVFSGRSAGASRWARPGPRRRCNWCRRSRVCRKCIHK